jgi:hypothetical protein
MTVRKGLPAAKGAKTPHLLYVVSRESPEVYQRLKRQVADAGVEIVLDRRQGERRREPRVIGVEQRRRERRVTDIRTDLARMGWAIVSVAPGDRPDGLGPGDRVVLRRYNPLLPQRLVGRSGRVLAIRRVRAQVHFDGEAKPRYVDLTDLGPARDTPTSSG